jgi:thiamine-phosphate pyrophosphorylase
MTQSLRIGIKDLGMRTKEYRMDIFKRTGLYFVTSSSLSRKDSFTTVRAYLEAGGRLFQLREKEWSKEKLIEEGRKFKKLSLQYDAVFIVNDDPFLALELSADGVHLGQNDVGVKEARRILGESAIIGVSTHSVKEALSAQEDGADYINIGPVFMTDTKKGIKNLSTLELIDILKVVKVPYTFMGGIKKHRIPELLGYKPTALAMITEISMAEDVKTATTDIIKAIGK